MISDPNVPGHPIAAKRNQVLIADLKAKTADLANSKQFDRFPGSQPVSLLRKHLRSLKNEDYYVCEKTDGVRYLLLICQHENGKSPMYLVSRKYEFYPVKVMEKVLSSPQIIETFTNSLLDGELVVDEIKDNEGNIISHKAMYLAYDVLNIRGQYVGDLALNDRLRVIQGEFVFPIQQLIKTYQGTPEPSILPFLFGIKQMYRKEDIHFVFDKILPNLKHENDGLIFTKVGLPVIHGTCEGILKWKPKHLNSVDFMLDTTWLNSSEDEGTSIFHFDDKAVSDRLSSLTSSSDNNIFDSFVYSDTLDESVVVRKQRYCKLFSSKRGMPHFYGYIYLSKEKHDELYEEYKGKPIVIECTIDPSIPTLDLKDGATSWESAVFSNKPGWSVLRVRTDKIMGNDVRTVQNVLKSIYANIGEAELKGLVGHKVQNFTF